VQQVVSDWSFMWLCGNFMRACVKSHRKCIFKRMIETSQIEKISTSERLQAMEQLWEALCRDHAEVSSPEWHGSVLRDRKARAEQGQAKFLTLDQLRARFRE